MAPSRRRPSGLTSGFTLIELLVVIAIIAILTAILLPVFASVQEGSRQSVAISNMKDIQQKMEQYKLDNHKYPDVLFGYAFPGSTMKTGLMMAQAYDAAHPATQTTPASNLAAIYFPGLYPAYIKDPNEFTDPNNPQDPLAQASSQVTGQLKVNLVAPCFANNDAILNGSGPGGSSGCAGAPAGEVVATTRSFYKLDAYDSGPVVLGTNKVDFNTFYPRYQLAREGTVCPTGVSPQPGYCDSSVSPTDADYRRQLRWQNPPADTVVTLTSYHVQKADQVLIMFQSGAVKKLKAEDFQLQEGPKTFWRYPAP